MKDFYSRILKQGLLFGICDFSIFTIYSEVVNVSVGHPVHGFMSNLIKNHGQTLILKPPSNDQMFHLICLFKHIRVLRKSLKFDEILQLIYHLTEGLQLDGPKQNQPKWKFSTFCGLHGTTSHPQLPLRRIDPPDTRSHPQGGIQIYP